MKASQPTHWGYLLKETVLILVMSFLLLFASTHNGLVSVDVLVVTASLLTLLWIAWVIKGQSDMIKIELPIAVFLLVLWVTCITSIDPRRSIAEVWLLGVAFFWFLLSADLSRRGWPGELIHKALLIVGGIIMALAWVGVITWYRDWFTATGQWLPDLTYRLPVSNFFSVLLNVLIMIALARWLFSPSRASRVLLGLWILSGLFLQFLTSSRGGWLGTLAGIVCLVGLYFYTEPTRWHSLWGILRKMRWAWVGVGVLGVLFLIGGGLVLNRQLQHPTHVPLAESRAYLWQPAWEAFVSSPWVGVGPYTYVSLFLRHHSAPPEQIFVYSHNIYLDLASSSGLIGLLAFGWLAWKIISTLITSLRNRSGLERAAILGALAALAAFAVHGLVDSVHHTIPTSAWVLALVVGPAVGCALGDARKVRHFSISLVIGFLVAVGAWTLIWVTAPLEKGVMAANAGNWSEAVDHLTQAVQRDPHDAIAHQQLALAYSAVAHEDRTFLDKARQELEQAVFIDPNWALNQANLGAVYAAEGDWAKAQYWLGQASRLAPFSQVFQLNLGIAAEHKQDLTAALAAYQQTLRLNPGWVDADFWQQTPFRQKIQADWRLEHPETNLSAQAQVEQLAANPGIVDPYLPLIRQYLAGENLERASELLHEAKLSYIATAQQDLELRWLEAELAAKKGDLKTAVESGQSVLADYQQWGMDGPGSFGKSVYAQLMFRRPAMMKDLVDQMVTPSMDPLWDARAKMLASWKINQ